MSNLKNALPGIPRKWNGLDMNKGPPYIRPTCYPAVSGGGSVIRLSLGKLLVNLLQVVKRTDTPLIPWQYNPPFRYRVWDIIPHILLVVVVLTLTHVIKSVVTGQAPVTLELRSTQHKTTHGGTRIYHGWRNSCLHQKHIKLSYYLSRILSYYHNTILSYYHTITLSYHHAILPYYHTIPPYYNTIILSYHHTIILSYYHTIILSYYHNIIISKYPTIIISYYHTIILSNYHTIILSYYHTIILSYYYAIILSYSHDWL